MNRRGFLQAVLKAGIAAAILPSAVTYTRRWVKTPERCLYGINPEWIDAPFECSFFVSQDAYGKLIGGPQPFIWQREHWQGEKLPNGKLERQLGKKVLYESFPIRMYEIPLDA